MRGGIRRHSNHEEEESAFISMTDMTVSFLFIVILLLAFFATQFSEEDTVPRSLFETIIHERNVAHQDIAELKAEIHQLKDRIKQLEENDKDELETYLARAAQIRSQILERLRTSINDTFKGVDAQISQRVTPFAFKEKAYSRKDSPLLGQTSAHWSRQSPLA